MSSDPLFYPAAGSSARPTTLLFVHGMFHAAWIWEDHFLPYFAERGYNAYAINLPGHNCSGQSRQRINQFRIRDFVEAVDSFARTLPTPPVLIGHSMGGYVVQKYMEDHMTLGGVLIASPSPVLGAWPAALRFPLRMPLKVIKMLLSLSLFPLVENPKLYRRTFFSREFPEEQARAYHDRLQNESFMALIDMLGLTRLHPVRVKMPVLVIGSKHDRLISQAEASRIANRYAGKPVIFSGIGHNMMLDTGWETVAARIHTWLRAHSI